MSEIIRQEYEISIVRRDFRVSPRYSNEYTGEAFTSITLYKQVLENVDFSKIALVVNEAIKEM
jgi:hypothetical protein